MGTIVSSLAGKQTFLNNYNYVIGDQVRSLGIYMVKNCRDVSPYSDFQVPLGNNRVRPVESYGELFRLLADNQRARRRRYDPITGKLLHVDYDETTGTSRTVVGVGYNRFKSLDEKWSFKRDCVAFTDDHFNKVFFMPSFYYFSSQRTSSFLSDYGQE